MPPEFGKVTVRNLYGLRTHEATGASQWVAVTDVALRHRADSMSWLMADLETSKRVPGVETMDFASPGMSLTNRSTWEAIMHGRAGVMPSPMAGGTPLMSVYGGGGAMILTPTGAPMSGTPMSGGGLRPIALANSLAVLGKRGAAEGGRDVDVMPPPPSRARVDDVAERKARWERAETAAAAHLKDGVAALFKHGGEEKGSVPLRNVVFAKSLLANNKFITAVEKLDTSSTDALLRTVEPAVAAILQVQKDSEFDMFDDLLGRLESLNATAARAAALAADPSGGTGNDTPGYSPGVAAPTDVTNLLAVGVLCASARHTSTCVALPMAHPPRRTCALRTRRVATRSMRSQSHALRAASCSTRCWHAALSSACERAGVVCVCRLRPLSARAVLSVAYGSCIGQ